MRTENCEKSLSLNRWRRQTRKSSKIIESYKFSNREEGKSHHHWKRGWSCWGDEKWDFNAMNYRITLACISKCKWRIFTLVRFLNSRIEAYLWWKVWADAVLLQFSRWLNSILQVIYIHTFTCRLFIIIQQKCFTLFLFAILKWIQFMWFCLHLAIFWRIFYNFFKFFFIAWIKQLFKISLSF